MDVLLKRKIDVAPGVTDLRDALDRADVLARHPRAQPRLDPRILEVKEVTGVVPHEPVAHDGAAVTAGLAGRFEHDHARVGMAIAPPIREAQARNAGADHDDVGRFGSHVSLASSLAKILRAIAIAQPYVLSMPKYDSDFDNRLWRRE